ncbi:MAG: LrgB family protein [Comamonadaceae bacterium]|nr:MAG: LrgB family protein [Comamonadaceae bacterium]
MFSAPWSAPAFMASAVLWITLTVVAYAGALWLYARMRGNPFFVPVASTSLVVMALLWLTRTPYRTYADATMPLSFLVGPATVALAVPLYAQMQRLRRIWRPLLVALFVGCSVALLVAIGVAWALGGSWETLVSVAPKSATMPIAMPMAERLGGLPALAAVAVVITGVVGTIVSHPLLNLLRVHDPAARGFAIGLTAHAIGMARELQIHPASGGFAALAMGLNGILTAVLMPLALMLFR